MGLHEGIPQTEHGSRCYQVLPDRITVFQKPAESVGGDKREIENEVQKVCVTR